MKRASVTLVLMMALALPLEAAIEYEARSWQEGERKNEQSDMTVLGKIDGEKARVEFRESGNPWMKEGRYLLTTNGGKTLYLVDPAEKTYGEFDLDEVMQLLGAFGDSGLLEFRIDNASIESLESGPGKEVAGVSTRHARFRTSYDMQIKVMGLKRSQNVQTIQDVWYSDELDDAALGVWLRKEPPSTGTELDELIDLEVGKISGFPLETIATMVTTGKKGKQSTTTSRTLVTRLERGASFPAGTFEIPDGYTPVQMMPDAALLAAGQPGTTEPQGDDEPKGGLMGRFKKLGKKN